MISVENRNTWINKTFHHPQCIYISRSFPGLVHFLNLSINPADGKLFLCAGGEFTVAMRMGCNRIDVVMTTTHLHIGPLQKTRSQSAKFIIRPAPTFESLKPIRSIIVSRFFSLQIDVSIATAHVPFCYKSGDNEICVVGAQVHWFGCIPRVSPGFFSPMLWASSGKLHIGHDYGATKIDELPINESPG